MKPENEIRAELSGFYGTTAYHRFSILFRNLVLTDGAKHLAESCQCFWLFDIVGSVLANAKGRTYFSRYSPVVVTVKRNATGRGAVVWLGNEKKPFYRQEIEYTDFPMQEYSFYVGDNGDCFVAMLFSEN